MKHLFIISISVLLLGKIVQPLAMIIHFEWACPAPPLCHQNKMIYDTNKTRTS